MIILLLQKLFEELEFEELAWCYIHEQELITQEILKKWLENWVEQLEKDEQIRNLFTKEIIEFLNNKKFELQEIQKLKQKLDSLGFKSN